MNDQTEARKSVGVIIVTHTDYGDKLLKAAEMILGPQQDVRCVSVNVGVDTAETVKQLDADIRALDSGGGVIIVTDMFGGTPTNLSLSLMGQRLVEVVTGVNLPMLIKILSTRTKALSQLAADAKTAGVQGIVVAGEILRKKVAGE
ncbi:PTS system mannose-specific EIIAB component [Fundidesulfovibrio magnetotacticus]|uniref:PTS system mannose-specific EIIAB component n=1 Tax=Fundidesulfovibrio magnetotacticus TaxID=2730080 RepID=A0A6V8LRN6_9BACT|nr:PTS sugar transporter subunit IIA [Fundidesulfovibrio magnetotacticus]GFK95142.1 PTS system mannose-specific EIIAB component [Fundidesulfovibrio magnetotacticus]